MKRPVDIPSGAGKRPSKGPALSVSVDNPGVQSLSSQLREMFLQGELSAGEPVRQEALAKRFGVSRVPIREALRVLETEGIVHHTPNSGYTIARLTESELDQTYMVREALEATLIRALPNVTTVDVEPLRAINTEMASQMRDGNVGAANALDRRFHLEMFALSGMGLVLSYVEMAWVRAVPYQVLVLYSPEQAQPIYEEHELMIGQLLDGDIEALVKTMVNHRAVGHSRVRGMLEILRRHGRNLLD